MKAKILKVAIVLGLFTISSSLIGQFAPSQSFKLLSLTEKTASEKKSETSTIVTVEEFHNKDFSELLTEDLVRENPDESWRTWKLIHNHEFDTDRGNLPMIADLQALHPYFRDKVIMLIDECKAQGIELAVVETYRTHAKQAEFYKMGKKYTRFKGGNSRHQYGLAVDVVPIVKGKPQWKNKRLWKKVGRIGEKLGLRWGGRWKNPYDPAHFEWVGGVSTKRLAKGVLPRMPKKEHNHYPCIDEDIAALKNSWKHWELEQSATARTLWASAKKKGK